MALLKTAILILSIPSILITSPSIALPNFVRRVSSVPLSKIILCSIMFALSFVPNQISSVVDDALLVITLSGTYALPGTVELNYLIEGTV